MFYQGYKYKVKFVKQYGENIIFQISAKKDKYYNASVMTKADPISMSIKDGDEVKLEKIKGIGLKEYNGKLQVTIFADIDTVEKYASSMGITESDLPF